MKRIISIAFIPFLALLLVDCKKKQSIIEPPVGQPAQPEAAPPSDSYLTPEAKPEDRQPKVLQPPAPSRKRSPAPGDSASLRLVETGVRALESGDLDGSEQVFEQALRVSPTNGKPYYYLGVVAMRRNEFDRALAFLTQAQMRFNVDSFWMSQALLQEGLVYKATGQKEKAREKLRQAIAQDPTNNWAQKELGTLQ